MHSAVARTRSSRRRRAALLAVLVACTGCIVVEAPTQPACVASEGLEVHAGPGYCISYPAGATVEQHGRPDGEEPLRRFTRREWVEHVEIRGEPVKCWRPLGRDGEEHWAGYEASSYRLVIYVYENPEDLDAETWARERILSGWRQSKAEGAPYGGAPVVHDPPDRPLEEAVIREDLVGRTTVAGYPAFRATFQGGAGTFVLYYLTSGPYVVTIRYE